MLLSFGAYRRLTAGGKSLLEIVAQDEDEDDDIDFDPRLMGAWA